MRTHQPRTTDEVAALVSTSSHVRVLGMPHAVDQVEDVVLDLGDLHDGDRSAAFDGDARTITVPAMATYAEVCHALRPHGAALHNLPALLQVPVAGAVVTAANGSGAGLGNLATAVAAVEMVTATGEIVTVDRRTPDFDGMVVSFGALGVITAITLDVVFDYEIEQHVYGEVPLDLVVEQLGMILHTAYSVSIFTTFAGGPSGQVGQVWLKRRADGADRSMSPGSTFLDAPAATMQHHPVPGFDGALCTQQLGVPGLWSDRLAHFRAGITPTAGNVLQSEFFVDSDDGAAAFAALRRSASEFADRLLVAEVRVVAADELWLSPQYRRDSIAFDFTWRSGDDDRNGAAIRAVEHTLAPFAPRPHWGKAFHAASFSVADTYEMFDDFVDLAVRFDPHGVFRNAWWQRHLGV